MGSSDSSLSLSSCREDSVRTGLVGDAGEAGGEGEVLEEVEGDSSSWAAASSTSLAVVEPPRLLPKLAGEEAALSHPAAPLEDNAFPRESSLDSFLASSPSCLLPSPHKSLSRVGEEGVDEGGGWCFLAFLLASLKLARGGRSLTPLRVEPSIAFCNCWRRERGGWNSQNHEAQKHVLEWMWDCWSEHRGSWAVRAVNGITTWIRA